LQVALDHAKTLQTASANDSLLRNCLAIDLFPLGSFGRDEKSLLVLAKLAETCNNFLQSKKHPWHYGADGPVFGIHLDTSSESESIPHLRAYCRYGPSVQDGWMAVRYMVEFLKSTSAKNDALAVAASVWDVQDGQLILIQLADLLPSWLDEDSTDNHRYACWIDPNGNLQLFQKPHINLRDALTELNRQQKHTNRSSSHPKLQEALDYWLNLNEEAAAVQQRTPMVLPRTVALAFEERPELLRTALQAFCEHAQQDGPIANAGPELDFTTYENWVWSIQRLPKTNYAMARTVCSTRGDWMASPDSVPTAVGVEVKRYKRQCKSEASKHLKHAVALGLRAVAGLELLLSNDKDRKHGIFATSKPISSLQERIFHWDRVQQMFCSGNSNNADRTILESFQLGPNEANLDLTNVLKCPVFPEEAHNWTSYTNPQSSLRDQVKSLLRSKAKDDNGDDDKRFWVPQPDQVDGEDWMDCQPGDTGVTTIDSQQGLDDLLTRFQSFLNQTSGVEGISSKETANAKIASDRIQIRPKVFLNILHAALKGDKLEFPQSDPYFYQEDYDLAQQKEEDSDSDSDSDDAGAFRMNDLMNAMDKELEMRTESRKIPKIETLESNDTNDDDDDDGTRASIDADAHILTNLLESIDASGGGSGPVINILKEMEDGG